MVAGYRDEQKRQLLAEASRRSNLIDSLLEGRAFDEWSLSDVAGYLRLPINGPFVVVGAQVPTVGDEPLPEVESKLRSLDMFSAWRLLPDLQIGIIHVASDQQLDKVVTLLSRMTIAPVGVSAPFDHLRDTPQALHVARVMLRARGLMSPCSRSILATAASSAGGDDQNGRRCAGWFWRHFRRGPGDALRNVSGLAGQRCVGVRCG